MDEWSSPRPPRRTVLVTGASSGIGRATALRFAADGFDVCVNARRAERLQELVAQFPAGEHLVCPGDYSEGTVVAEMERTVKKRWGRLDALVNCAGVFVASDAIDSPLDEWRRPFDVMVDGAVRVTRMAAPLLSAGGCIVHITSIHGDRAEARSSALQQPSPRVRERDGTRCPGEEHDAQLLLELTNRLAHGRR